MADINDPRIAALAPLTRRVRRDVTAVKRNGRQSWTDEPLTRLRLAQHLNGGPARGVCPIQSGQDVTMVGLYDLDSHDGASSWAEMAVAGATLVDVLSLAWGAHPIAFRSSGGRGIHVYLVWDQPQPARDVRAWMAQVLQSIGMRSGTRGIVAGEVEVFPKQDRVPVGGYGNQFILPLAGQSEPLTLCDLSGALVPTGAALTADAWVPSPDVPPVAEDAPVYGQPKAAAMDLSDALWPQALDAIPNGRDGQPDLGYDEWRDIIFAIHFETGGSDQGLAIAQEFSVRSPKHDIEFLTDRVWHYIRSDRDRPVTGDTICWIAATQYGWRPEIPLEAFPLTPVDPEEAARDAEAFFARELAATEPPPADSVVDAQGLCTDLSNACRLVTAAGGRMLTMGGMWYVWDGRRYRPDPAAAMRESCGLSALVRKEADAAEAEARAALAAIDAPVAPGEALPKATPFAKDAGKRRRAVEDEGAAAMLDVAVKAVAKADALRGWVSTSEMKARIDAALALAGSQVQVEADVLDADPWLVTCLNGTVDLRTGTLRPHSPADRITQLIPVDFDPAADSSAWESVLLQICAGDTELAAFLQRWFGYSLTGHVREQVFLVHYGQGSNGKSLLLDLMGQTSGDYAAGAPPGLVASTRTDSMKDTELAVLRGRRMITAHESRAGSELREDFVKIATGDDVITARLLFKDTFDFKPTHKLQLLTNHRPIVRTQDHGTWRRIVLVPYKARFGTADAVLAGEATAVADQMLAEKLRQPDMLRAILAWRVRGAMTWAQTGLQIPASVRLTSEEYRADQDKTGRFVHDCCERGAGFEEVLSGSNMLTLYAAYRAWAQDAGTHPVASQRLGQDLERLGFEVVQNGRSPVVRGLRLRAE